MAERKYNLKTYSRVKVNNKQKNSKISKKKPILDVSKIVNSDIKVQISNDSLINAPWAETTFDKLKKGTKNENETISPRRSLRIQNKVKNRVVRTKQITLRKRRKKNQTPDPTPEEITDKSQGIGSFKLIIEKEEPKKQDYTSSISLSTNTTQNISTVNNHSLLSSTKIDNNKYKYGLRKYSFKNISPINKKNCCCNNSSRSKKNRLSVPKNNNSVAKSTPLPKNKKILNILKNNDISPILTRNKKSVSAITKRNNISSDLFPDENSSELINNSNNESLFLGFKDPLQNTREKEILSEFENEIKQINNNCLLVNKYPIVQVKRLTADKIIKIQKENKNINTNRRRNVIKRPVPEHLKTYMRAMSEQSDLESINSVKGSQEGSEIILLSSQSSEIFNDDDEIELIQETPPEVIEIEDDPSVSSQATTIVLDDELLNSIINKTDNDINKSISDDIFKKETIVNSAEEKYELLTAKETKAYDSRENLNCDIKLFNNSFKVPQTVSVIKNSERKSVLLDPGKKWRRSCIKLMAMKKIVLEDRSGNHGNCRLSATSTRSSIRIVHENRQSTLSELGVLASSRLDNRRSGYEAESRASTLDEQIYLKSVNGISVDLNELSLRNIQQHLNTTSDCSIVKKSARDIVLRRCGQAEQLVFEKCYPECLLEKCQKIGEGVYGEVFLLKEPSGRMKVLKVIPIEGDLPINGERQKIFDEVLTEIIISQELCALRNGPDNLAGSFPDILQTRCVRGKYPDKLCELWDLYQMNKTSQNDDPAEFPSDQQYIVIEMGNAGTDLEAFKFKNAEQSFHIFLQIASGLAVAEASLLFEHRDLHWGNVLVSYTADTEITFKLRGKQHNINSIGLKATIIDFTLSRITYDDCAIYNDLAQDPEIFESDGDYQFDVYRLMQNRNGNNWRTFTPCTNILWLHYLLDKMINQVHYTGSITTKKHLKYITIMESLKAKILGYNSVEDFVLEYHNNYY